jgi:hypothetical protein
MSVNEYGTVTEAIEGLQRRGFTANFEFMDNAVQDVNRRKAYRAEELTIVEHHRLEGATNPDDMAIVYAIEAADGTRGIVVDAFGPYADPGLGAFLERVKIREAA